jgi:hypothetical protein
LAVYDIILLYLLRKTDGNRSYDGIIFILGILIKFNWAWVKRIINY